MKKKFNEDSEIEVIAIKVTNSQWEKEDGLMIHYGADSWKPLGGLGISSTMMFVSPKKISKGGVVKPEMREKIVGFMREFLENYLEELSEELKKPVKKDK